MKKIITSIFIAFMMITTIIPVNALDQMVIILKQQLFQT